MNRSTIPPRYALPDTTRRAPWRPEMLGGGLSVESEPSKGSLFKFNIPLSHAKSSDIFLGEASHGIGLIGYGRPLRRETPGQIVKISAGLCVIVDQVPVHPVRHLRPQIAVAGQQTQQVQEQAQGGKGDAY